MAVDSTTLAKRLQDQIAAAQIEKAKTEALFSSMGEGLIATDEHGFIIRANQIASDILGYPRKEMIGQWFSDRCRALKEDGTPIEEMERPSVKAFVTGKTVNQPIYCRNKSGEILPLAVSISPILWRNKPRGLIAVFRDITADILNDKMKTDFISIASHQLRTPLSSINTYAHMIAEGYAGKLNKTQLSFVETIMSATERMNELISTLLNVTRIESGNIIIKNLSLKLDQLVKEIVNEFRSQTQENKISLKLSIKKPLPPVLTDKVLVREIIVNLITNAIKYTGEGGAISIKLYEDDKNLIFRIQDTGYGIPENVQAQIFTKFFRAPNVTGKDVSGTGLGLYLTRVLAELLNGDIWFDSVENQGTDFFFSLPKSPTRKPGAKPAATSK